MTLRDWPCERCGDRIGRINRAGYLVVYEGPWGSHCLIDTGNVRCGHCKKHHQRWNRDKHLKEKELEARNAQN